MKSVYKMVIGAFIFITVIALIYYFGLSHYFSLESVKTNGAYLKEQAMQHRAAAVLIFIGISTTLVAFTLPVTGPVAVIAGFLFNFVPAVCYTMIASLVGTAVSFIVVRYFMRHVMETSYNTQLLTFKDKLTKYGYSYLITLQLLTVVPYFIINTLAALANVPFHIFMWTTFIGSLPIIMIYAFAGRQLYMIQSWKDILSLNMLGLLLLLAGLALLPMLIRRFRNVD